MTDVQNSAARRIVHSCEGDLHLCRCCVLDVMTHGPTEAVARHNLIESNLRTAAISHDQFLQLAK